MSDSINRQAAIEIVDFECGEWRGLAETIEKRLSGLPSAQPERKKGKWIRKSPTAWSWTCSCCKKDDAYAYSAGESFNPDVLQDFFCPNCGADMRGEQDG